MNNEAFPRVKIDAQLKDQGWDIQNSNAVRFEYILPDGKKADYVLCDRYGRSLAIVEAKRASANPADAAIQAKAYVEQLQVPFIFLSNGDEARRFIPTRLKRREFGRGFKRESILNTRELEDADPFWRVAGQCEAR